MSDSSDQLRSVTVLRVTLLARLLPVVYFMLTATLVVLSPGSIDVSAAAKLIVSLMLLASLPGAALARRFLPHSGLFTHLVLGTVLGLGMWSLGGMLSHMTGLFVVRWIPVAVGLGLWLVKSHRVSLVKVRGHRRPPAMAIAGAGLALTALIPAVGTALRSQPVQWTGWYRFYTDLPFHTAITSEVSTRIPQESPWVADTMLNYTWLFHSAMGVWGSAANVPSASIVMQAWPILFAVLMPAVISIVAWEITHNRYVAGVAPLIYVFAHGLVLTPGTLQNVPLFQISPTRDFAHLFLLLTILSLTRLLGIGSVRAINGWWLLVLGLCTFVATGAKGSAMPILLGGLLCALLYLVVVRRARASDLFVALTFAVSAIASYLLVLPEPGHTESLAWGPLTFLSAETPGRIPTSVFFLAVLALAIVGIWQAIGRSDTGGWLVASLISGVLGAGLLGMALLTYPGDSQLYFWQSAQPVMAIGLSWAVVILVSKHGWRFILAAVGIYFASNVIWSVVPQRTIVAAAIVVMAILASIYVIGRRADLSGRRLGFWSARGVSTLVCVALLTQAAQLVSIPMGTIGGATANAKDTGAIHESQLRALQFIRDVSTPTQRVITNKHCLDGSLEAGDCDQRWFATAAWTERRVIADGWGYTQHGPSRDWVQQYIDVGDGFIASPTIVEKRELQSMGVRFVYVDKREPYDEQLEKVARVIYSSEWANVYSLN